MKGKFLAALGGALLLTAVICGSVLTWAYQYAGLRCERKF